MTFLGYFVAMESCLWQWQINDTTITISSICKRLLDFVKHCFCCSHVWVINLCVLSYSVLFFDFFIHYLSINSLKSYCTLSGDCALYRWLNEHVFVLIYIAIAPPMSLALWRKKKHWWQLNEMLEGCGSTAPPPPRNLDELNNRTELFVSMIVNRVEGSTS